MSPSQQRLRSLKEQQEQIGSQIANLEQLRNNCNCQIQGEGDSDKRSQLRIKMNNYSTEIEQLYDELERVEQKIKKLKLDDKDLSLNNYLDNPQNQQELSFDKSLCYIDFKKALETFEQIQSQFSKEGDVALLFMEEHLIKRGDLCLRRLRDDLTPFYRQHFRPCSVTYKAGNLEAVVQGIANFFQVKQEEITVELVINTICDSLQNNSILFIEINCDISEPDDIDPLIPWFINKFWQPLREKISEIVKDYEGIKVVTVIISDVLLNCRLSTEKLSCYCNDSHNYFDFARDKLVKIPLENWTKDDIANWLIKYCDPSLKRERRNEIVNKIYNTTNGFPTAVCFALETQWQTLIHPTTSC